MSAASKKAPELLDHLAWLGYTQIDSEGLVVSAPALVGSQVVIDRASLAELQDRFSAYVTTLRLDDRDTGESAAGIGELPRFFTDFLNWPIDCLVGWDAAHPLPIELSVSLREFGETLTPTYALAHAQPKAGESPWLLLVQAHPPTTDLTKPIAAGERGWGASPAKKFERLLRETGIPIGLLTNGVSFQLVYAPPKENSGTLTFKVASMTEIPGRLILGAFHLLLCSHSFFTAPTPQRLPTLLQTSRSHQASVSEKLAEQVLHALYELLRGFVAAEQHAKTKHLHDLAARHSEDIYGGLVTVLLRLVFVLFAEDRALLPTKGLFVKYYSVRGLYERLRSDAERHPDTMDHRYGAWAQLLALFRLIHGGCRHEEMPMPAREGHLFDPERYPFLEGRVNRDDLVEKLPLISDGVIYGILDKLCVLEGERVSYRTLDVEEIGSVYQTIMGFGIEIVSGTAIALKGKRKKGSVPAAPIVDLEALLNQKPADRLKFLNEDADTKLTGEAEQRVKGATSVDDLLAALEKRIDRNSTPSPVAKGGLVLYPTDERRRSGSHYTPRSFTEPIVRRTLEPVLARLIAFAPISTPSGRTPAPEQILDLKIADIAVGSAAFLVEACRQLGDALVVAWRMHGGRPPLPPDETEELLAMRLIAQRCLYGVDRNPMAVDLAKLSLWLATLAKDHPFTFLDHNIRPGDSLVGLTQKQIEAFTWEGKTAGKQSVFGQDFLVKRIKAATSYRREILEGGDFVLPSLKAQKLKLADEALEEVRFAGDLIVSAFFAAEKDKARREKLEELRDRYVAWLTSKVIDPALKPRAVVEKMREGHKGVWPFHWEIQFPEIFAKTDGGFDAVIGNPPFVGGKKISGALGKRYALWLSSMHPDSSGNADLVAHFFRRAFALCRKGGTQGLIATNTIAQGDTRRAGLREIVRTGGVIYNATKRQKWPGAAAVVVSVVCIAKSQYAGGFTIDARKVDRITAFLFHAGDSEDPVKLSQNSSRSFIGCDIKGQGFLFDDQDPDANPTALMHRLIDENRINLERIRPYIGAEELNDEPSFTPRRWVITFGEMDESEAARWPDLLQILRDKVQPERATKAPDLAAWPWWRFWRPRQELYTAIRPLQRTLVCPQTSKYLSFAFMSPTVVFSHKLVVLADDSYFGFCCLQSRAHQEWADFFGSSMKDDPVYTPSDCFETFPFPQAHSSAEIAHAGQQYYEYRSILMVKWDAGLTDIYNRFHDPDEHSLEIETLRQLHAAMDRAVLNAYGWTDISIDCEFLLDYEDENDSEIEGRARLRKKPWRYRWPDVVRDEVLARLLKLNAERAEQDRFAGEATVPKKPAKKIADKKPGRKPKVAPVVTLPATRQLPTDLRLPENDPVLYAVGLVVALLSEAGGSLPWLKLLDAFVLATQPKQLVKFAPPELELAASDWAEQWGEKTTAHDLLPAIRKLGGGNLVVEESLLGFELSLQDGAKKMPPHVAYDAWLALRVGAMLEPSAALISTSQRETMTAELAAFVA
jgi:hypothetical protein